MERAKFNELNEDVQKEFLERGGTIEEPPAAGQRNSNYMRWSYKNWVNDTTKSNRKKKKYSRKKR